MTGRVSGLDAMLHEAELECSRVKSQLEAMEEALGESRKVWLPVEVLS